MIKYLTGVVIALVLYGCNSPQPVEYVYIDKNCTNIEDLIQKPARITIRWTIIDINGTRYYATQDGLSLAIRMEE